ncbi:hypothetical protein LTS08_007921, partial [Lithohypha guttulata]
MFIKALAAAARFPPMPYQDRDGEAHKDRADDYRKVQHDPTAKEKYLSHFWYLDNNTHDIVNAAVQIHI